MALRKVYICNQDLCVCLPRVFTRKRGLRRLGIQTRKSCHGFTLIETLVFLGLLGIIASIGLMGSMESYKGYSFRNDRDLLVSVLHKARNRSINNVCLGAGCTGGRAHGVHVQAGQFIIFQGTSYAARDMAVDEVVSMGSETTQISGATDVMFSNHSGFSTTLPAGVWDITITDPSGHSSIVTINTEGRITWTN